MTDWRTVDPSTLEEGQAGDRIIAEALGFHASPEIPADYRVVLDPGWYVWSPTGQYQNAFPAEDAEGAWQAALMSDPECWGYQAPDIEGWTTDTNPTLAALDALGVYWSLDSAEKGKCCTIDTAHDEPVWYVEWADTPALAASRALLRYRQEAEASE